jgi:phage terminase large subunit
VQLEYEFPEKLAYLFEDWRYKIGRGGRGGSKSWGYARALLAQGRAKPLRILCAREVQKSIKESVKHLLDTQIQRMGLGAHYTSLDQEIRGNNGTEFIFSGLASHTAESIKSYEDVDIAWIEEAQKVSRRSWDILIPTIRKPGSQIWVSLNPELDTDETWVRFVENSPKNSHVEEINWRDNPWFPEILKDEREEFLKLVSKGIRTQDEYDNIWEGKTRAAVEGAIYAREVTEAKLKGRLRDVPYDPLLKVHPIWDLGWNDKMSIALVQRSASELRFIDYIEDSHKTYAEYDAMLRARPYRYAKDWLPHDGRAKSPESGRSPEDILRALGRSVDITPEIGVEPGIQAARLMFPRCYFDKERCTPLFNRLSRYKRSINKSNNEPGKPEHDENSHGSDAFRYVAVNERNLINEDMVAPDINAAFRRRA